MANRIVSIYERYLTTTVGNIEHIESQTLTGIGVVKIYFQPGSNIAASVAEVAACTAPALRFMPPGTTPPLVITYSASTVPILQLGLTSDHLNEQQISDMGQRFIRNGLV